MFDILSIGNSSYDLTIPLDSFPDEDSKIETYESFESGGGPAANAVNLMAGWGLKCAYAGIIGGDHYGKLILNEFKQIGIDTSLCRIKKNGRTPYSIILVNKENGSRTLINIKNQGQFLDIRRGKLEHFYPRFLYFDGHEPEASLKAIEIFPEAKTVLDAGSLREGTKLLCGRVDYLAASEKFAKQITEIDDLNLRENRKKCLKRLKFVNKNNIIVTIGERGLFYDNNGIYCEMKAYSPFKVTSAKNILDTTGAGDIFHGAFTYGLIKGYDLPFSLKLGTMAAALSTVKYGARNSIPLLSEVMENLSKDDI